MTPTPKQSKRGTAPPEPALRFPLTEASHARMSEVLTALEQADDPEDHREELADLVADLTQAGMDYYYLRALKLAGAGAVATGSAKVGISTAVKMISSVSRSFIMRMDTKQLLKVSTHIRSLAE